MTDTPQTTRPCPSCGITAPMGNAVWIGYSPDCSSCGGGGRVNLDGSRWQTTRPPGEAFRMGYAEGEQAGHRLGAANALDRALASAETMTRTMLIEWLKAEKKHLG